jgi:hypothetical protein
MALDPLLERVEARLGLLRNPGLRRAQTPRRTDIKRHADRDGDERAQAGNGDGGE